MKKIESICISDFIELVNQIKRTSNADYYYYSELRQQLRQHP
jgi:hypothetical protein